MKPNVTMSVSLSLDAANKVTALSEKSGLHRSKIIGLMVEMLDEKMLGDFLLAKLKGKLEGQSAS